MSDDLNDQSLGKPTLAVEVFQNVVNILGVILFLGMITFGGIYFKACPSQPMLSISMIVQGGLSLTLPVLYLLKFRFKMSLADAKYYTIFVTDVILCIGWFVALTVWLAEADCRDVVLHKAGICFCVVLWFVLGVSSVGLMWWWWWHRRIKKNRRQTDSDRMQDRWNDL